VGFNFFASRSLVHSMWETSSKEGKSGTNMGGGDLVVRDKFRSPGQTNGHLIITIRRRRDQEYRGYDLSETEGENERSTRSHSN